MSNKLFVGALPFVYTNEELRALFVGIGRVLSAVMIYDPDRDRTRGFGFVEMSTEEEARTAIAKLTGLQVGEKKIFVTEARERKPADPNKTPDENRFKGPRFRKVGRNPGNRPSSASGPANPYSGPPRSGFGARDRRPGPSRFGESRGRPFRSRDERAPGSFGRSPSGGPPRNGFSRPSPWRPSGERPGSAPRGGSSNRKPFNSTGKPIHGFGPRRSHSDSRPPSSGRPPKKTFWRKFDKKK